MCHHIERGVAYDEAEEHADPVNGTTTVETEDGPTIAETGDERDTEPRRVVPNADD